MPHVIDIEMTVETDPKDSSSTLSQVGIGLSDTKLSEERRKLLDLMNRLHSTGVQIDMDLPMIAVIGSQSAGKSSLIESISGITLPRAAGTCTRCPTECRLSHSNKQWQCIVSLRFITDGRGQPLGQVRNEKFGETIFDKSEVEERIRRAQRAILNPYTKSPQSFLEGTELRATSTELSFSKNCVSLAISGPDVADLSFCDLPGLIASVSQGGNANDIELVKSLVTSYIEKPSCLILSTVACETDFENQGAHLLAKTFDPEGTRTVGVLTKPDRIPIGEESRWLQFIKDERESLVNGWYCVKQPDSRSLSQGLTWSAARKGEDDFFMGSLWSSLDPAYQRRLRTINLTSCLSHILSELIESRLPGIYEGIYELLKKTDEDIHKLPPAPSMDSVGEVIRLINSFIRVLSQRLQGTPDADGLLQTIRPKQEQFKRVVHLTAPNFQPWKKDDQDKDKDRHIQTPEFLFNEELRDSGKHHISKKIYIDEVLERAQTARTRELPDNYPFVVQKAYINQFIDQWHDPALYLFDNVYNVLKNDVDNMVTEHFSQIGRGHLQKLVMATVKDHLDTRAEVTKQHIEWLLQLERSPDTLNTHYYCDYKDKFMSHYRGARHKGTQLTKSLNTYPVGGFLSSRTTEHEHIMNTLSHVNSLGINGVKPNDLLKLLPSDPMEPALLIMAGVRAYFQVAYKRFVDVVPMAIDHDLVQGLETGLEKALLDGLGVTGAEGYEQCCRLLQENHFIRIKRHELQMKRERLNTAKNELRQLNM